MVCRSVGPAGKMHEQSNAKRTPCVLCDAPTCADDHGVLWLVALTQGGQVAFVTCREG